MKGSRKAVPALTPAVIVCAASKKIHLIAGNGDQLYSDGITRATPEIAAAFGADDKDATLSFKWTASLSKAVDDWVSLCKHGTVQSVSCHAMTKL